VLRLKYAENRWRESEERYRRISSLTSDIAYSCIKSNNTAYSIDWIMGAVERITGHSEEDIKSLGCWRTLVIDEDRTIFDAKVNGISPGTSASCELRLRHKSGRIVWVASSAECVLASGTPDSLRLYGGLVDITERKIDEEALRQSEDKFSKAFFLSPDAIAITRLVDGVYVAVNEGFKATLGYTEEEVIGKTSLELNVWVNPEDRNRVIDGLKSEGRVDNFEARFRTKTGDIRYGLISVSIIDLRGVPHILNIARDITDRKQAERRQHLTSEILGILNNTSDLTDSIKLILDVIKRDTDFDAVGIRLQSGDDFPYFVQSGFSQDFLLTENTLIARDASGPCRDENGNIRLECTCGLVLSGQSDATSSLFTEGGSIWTNDSRPFLDIPAEQDPRFHPRNNCVHNGFLSVALIPIRANRDIVGLLQLNDRDKDSFTLEMIHFFEGISASIGVALLNKLAEEELRISEDKFSKAFHMNPDAILITRLVDGMIVMVNEGFMQIFGATEEEVIGKTALELNIWVNPEDRNRVIQGVKADGKVNNFEFGFCTRGGDVRSGLMSASIITLDGVDHILSITRDLTEHKQLEEKNLRLAVIVESSDDAIIGKTLDGTITTWNNGAEKIYGYKEHEAIGKPITSLVPHDREDEILGFLEEIKSGKSVKNFETVRRNQDGDTIHVSLTISPIIDKEGDIVGASTIVRDISDRVKAAQEKQALQEQLLQSQKMEAVGTLAGGIAHDFNNLLQIVLGYSEVILLRKKEGESDYVDIQKIYQAGRRGADLINSLLTFSRKVETQYVPMDLNQEIATVRDLLFNTIAKTITIDLHLSENLASIQADRSQIGQVLMNLGVNARDAMPDGGTLRIETTNIQLDEEYCITHPEAKPESYVLLTVSDTGLGMDKETLSHIFEPFFTTKEQGKGTGLGLATVYGIVKNHGGYINCNSEIGHGTTFNIYLPTIQTDQILETSPIETTIPGGTETILLVEDDGVIRELCAELLTGVGYKVFSAGNGKEALEIYQMEKHKISLILLDLIMPVMDGWQCLAKILRIDPKAKVIIASGYIASGLAKGMQAKGARGFVQKPFETNQLLTTIREVLDKD
jgi:PAS domain S-box-containing protein